MDAMKKRMFKALGTVIIACVVGTVGFYLLDAGQHTVPECFFMTVITLATVGYREVIPLDMYGQLFASMLIIFGMGTLIYPHRILGGAGSQTCEAEEKNEKKNRSHEGSHHRLRHRDHRGACNR